MSARSQHTGSSGPEHGWDFWTAVQTQVKDRFIEGAQIWRKLPKFKIKTEINVSM